MPYRRKKRKRSTEAQSLQAKQFKPKVIPDKKKDIAPEPELHTSVELVMVDPGDVITFWPLAYELLAPELPKTNWTPDQLRDACMTGHTTLWLVCDQDDKAIAAMVTTLTSMGRCLVIVCCGHNLWDFVDARYQLYDWARNAGMQEVVFYGRDALAKLMPECKRGGVILRKEL